MWFKFCFRWNLNHLSKLSVVRKIKKQRLDITFFDILFFCYWYTKSVWFYVLKLVRKHYRYCMWFTRKKISAAGFLSVCTTVQNLQRHNVEIQLFGHISGKILKIFKQKSFDKIYSNWGLPSNRKSFLFCHCSENSKNLERPIKETINLIFLKIVLYIQFFKFN